MEFDGAKWINHKDSQPKGNKFVRKIRQDPDGNMWFITESKGIFYYNGKELRNPEKTEDFEGEGKVMQLFLDSESNIWVGSTGSVSVYNGEEWRYFDDIVGPLEFVEMNGGEIVLVAMNGIYIYEGTSFKFLEFNNTGHYTARGLSQVELDPLKYADQPEAVKPPVVKDIEDYLSFIDRNGNLWIYFNNNFGNYDGNTWIPGKEKAYYQVFC